MARSTKNALTMSYSNMNKYSDAKTNETFKWCATSTNADGRMKSGKWGRCGMSSCEWESPESKTQSSDGLSGGGIVRIIIDVFEALFQFQ